jgi:hypothetical protein
MIAGIILTGIVTLVVIFIGCWTYEKPPKKEKYDPNKKLGHIYFVD